MLHRRLLALSVAGAMLLCASCTSASDEVGDQAKWCELTIENTAAVSGLSEAALADWIEAAPIEVRDETESFAVIGRELAERTADLSPAEQVQAAQAVLAEIFSDPDLQLIGSTLQQYAFENCPDFEG